MFLLLANFRQNFDLKNMISFYARDFSRKKNPNSPDFEDSFIKITKFL
jgi:hypothetical protein